MSNGNKFIKTVGLISIVCFMAFGATPAAAAYISITPLNQVAKLPTDSVPVHIWFSNPYDRGAAEDKYVGAFDFNLTYNPDVLELDLDETVDFGDDLERYHGDSLQEVKSQKGTVNFSHVSLLSPADLSDVQRGTGNLKLISVYFKVISEGESSITLSGNLEGSNFLGDENGIPIVLDHVETGNVSVSFVPIPGSVVLMLSGLASILGIRRKSRK